MRTLPAGMDAHLATGATTLAWCWRLEAADGTVLGFTDHDRDLVVAGTTYRATTGITASAATHELGLAVGSLTAEGALRSDALTETDLLAGKWDNAAVELWRVNWQDVGQAVLVKAGNLGEVSRGDVAFEAEVRGLGHAAQQPRGRVYGARCDATLGDARCGVNLADPAWRGTGTVVSADGVTVRATGLGAFAQGWFARGLLTFTGGAASGLAYDVVAHAAGDPATLTLQDPLVHQVAAGDTFTVTAGCDKRLATCRDKFANVANFRGFPHMPGDDFAVTYANGTTAGDGTQRYGQF